MFWNYVWELNPGWLGRVSSNPLPPTDQGLWPKTFIIGWDTGRDRLLITPWHQN
jgi:hypothetical protein